MTSETFTSLRRLWRPMKLVLAWAALVVIGMTILHLPAAASGESLNWLDANWVRDTFGGMGTPIQSAGAPFFAKRRVGD